METRRLHLLSMDGQLVTFAENIADTTEFAGLVADADVSAEISRRRRFVYFSSTVHQGRRISSS